LIHLMKLHGWPNNESANHWRSEIDGFQTELEGRISASLRRRLDLAAMYSRALRRTNYLMREMPPGRAWPMECPVSLDELIDATPEELESAFAGATPQSNA